MKNGEIAICIGFDGTICEDKFPGIGEVKPGAIKAIKALDKTGFKIIIHTERANYELINNQQGVDYLKEMESWLKEKEIPYDGIWKGAGKPICDLYIENRCLQFDNWANVVGTIISMLVNYKASKIKGG